MTTLLKIAWRNIWRNKLRSSVVITSIILGIWAGLFVMAMAIGMTKDRAKSAIETYLSHIQIHNPKYIEAPSLKYYLNDANTALTAIQKNNSIKAVSKRLIVNGMLNTTRGTSGIQIIGILPDEESKVTSIHNSLIEGTYLTKFKKNPVVVGQKLAEKYKLKLKSKIVITLQDEDKNIISTSFRIEGIYKATNSMYEENTIFVKSSDLRNITGLTDQIHEIAILCNNVNEVDQVANQLKKNITKDKVETYKEISPDIGYTEDMMNSVLYIFMSIILLTLAFGIVNTMQMAVLERRKEIGMLMAIGMNKRRVFLMIMLETLFMSMVATPIAVVLSFISIQYFGKYGIDLSSVNEGLSNFGISTKIYTTLEPNLYFNITLLTIFIAFLASISPARRALKLKPTETIGSI